MDVPSAERKLHLDAAPTTGTFITSLDLDLTVQCNLRCTYCFKEKWNEHMEERVAFDAVVWLFQACGPHKSVRVAFMGGEPLIRLKMIKKLVPFAKRRAAQQGKRIHFGMTTNGTLVTDNVVEFWTKWGMGFHTSIDGTPEIQDRNRPTTSGRPSSRLVEKAVPKILSYRSGTCARSTVLAESGGRVFESYRYFRRLRYVDIAFVPAAADQWTLADIKRFEASFTLVGEAVVQEFRSGNVVFVKGISDYARALTAERSPFTCGAGRGMALIDICGDIWPCHRWNKARHSRWRIGSIYGQFSERARQKLDAQSQIKFLNRECDRCIAHRSCSGGCPAENLELTGHVYEPHPNSCELTRCFARVGKKVADTLMAENNQCFRQTHFPEEATDPQ